MGATARPRSGHGRRRPPVGTRSRKAPPRPGRRTGSGTRADRKDGAWRGGRLAHVRQTRVWETQRPMKRVLLLGPLLLVALAGCTAEPDDPTVVTSTVPSTTVSESQVALPADPQPASAGPCPYLEESYVADTNGQHVAKVKVSAD